MNYTIVDFDESSGCIAVKFDGVNSVVKIDLPVVDGLYPTGASLDALIVEYFPTWETLKNKREDQIKNGVANADKIQALVKQGEKILSSDEILDAPSLEVAIQRACYLVDRKADQVRNLYSTSIRGQDIVYLQKYQQALQFKNSTDEVRDVPSYIAAQIEITHEDPMTIAESIISAYETFEAISTKVEAARIIGKNRVRASTTLEQVKSMMNGAIKQIDLSIQ